MSKVIYHEAFAKTIILNRKFTVLKKMDRTSFISSYNSRKQSSRRQSWQLSYNWKMEWEINLIKLNGKLNTRSLRVWLSFWSLYVGLKKLRIEDRRLKPESATVVVHKKAAFKNIAKLTGNHLCQGLFFTKVLYKNFFNRVFFNLAQVFLCEFAKFLRTPVLKVQLCKLKKHW